MNRVKNYILILILNSISYANTKREDKTMKKLLVTVFATFFAFTVNIASADVSGLAMGISLSNNELDTLVTDDIDSNGTITTTKALTDTVQAGSIFAELTLAGPGSLAVTLGAEHIPVDADLDKRTATQSSIKGAGTLATGTNSGKATIEDHFTFYIQPGFVISENPMLYGTLGYARADITATWESVSSTNTTKVQSMNGTKIGVGVKHVRDNGIVLKLDYSQTDYDKVSYTTTNSTKVTGDIDNTVIALSIGKSF